jgi:hypothetical protein
MEEKRPLRRQPDDHHFWSLIILAGAFLLVTWVATKAPFVFLQESPILENRLAKACPCVEWLSRIGYVRDSAALVLEEIAPEDKNRNEVLGPALTST